jgi:hypothetical protein
MGIDTGAEECRRLLVGLVVDLGVGDVALDRLDAVDRARLALVGLAGGDHLTVRGDQVEAELPGRPFLSTNLAAMRALLVKACLLGLSPTALLTDPQARRSDPLHAI